MAQIPGQLSAQINTLRLSPVAISAAGTVAYLGQGEDGQESGHKITIETFEGRHFDLEFPDQIAVLAFANNETLLIGDRIGGVHSIATNDANAKMRNLGSHTGRVTAIVPSNDTRILSVGADDIVRMWNLDFTEDMVGVSGIMEFPLISFGIANLSYLGTAGVALEDDRLVILNQSARGIFAHVWKVPLSADMVSEAEARLGPPIDMGVRN